MPGENVHMTDDSQDNLEGHSSDGDVLELRLQPWAHSGEMKIYVRPLQEPELREALTAEGLRHDRVYEFAEGPVLVAIVVAVASSPAWTALASAIHAFLNRNQSKTVKVVVGGDPTEFTGYSRHDVERLIDRVEQLHELTDQQTRGLMGGREVPTDEFPELATDEQPD